jgi:hypothetical protein
MMAVENGIVTDHLWKCVGVPAGKKPEDVYKGWLGLHYDDSEWPRAQVTSLNRLPCRSACMFLLGHKLPYYVICYHRLQFYLGRTKNCA